MYFILLQNLLITFIVLYFVWTHFFVVVICWLYIIQLQLFYIHYFLCFHFWGLALSGKGNLLPIGAAAKKAGISRQSLQYYLMVGLLEPTEVTPSGRRMFDEKGIERIKLIKKLNDSGYPLRAIRELFMEGRGDMKGS